MTITTAHLQSGFDPKVPSKSAATVETRKCPVCSGQLKPGWTIHRGCREAS